ncbi:MAG: hypothetical protein N3A65_06810 [candidate division WOR-3 bacterium]|nr:hypothetical protein [candidate division WOR-3 bacterium]
MFLLSAAIQVVFLILFAYKGLWFILAVLVITGLFFYTLFSVPRMFYFFTAYITISVEYLYLSYFPGFPVYYSLKIAIPLFILLLVYWLTYLLKTEERADLRILDYFIISHLVLSIISAARGYFYGYKLSYCVWDFMAQFWYLGYFIFQYSPLKNHIERLYDMLLVFTLLLSFEYIYGYTKLASLGGLFLTRIVGKNIHLAQFAIPYIGGIFIFGAPRWRKFLAGLSLPFILVAVFFSQQRSLWFSITITLIILLIIFLYVRRRWLIKNVKKILLVSLLLVLVFIVLNVILDLYFKQKLFLTAFARFLIFLNPELFTYDLSWRIRWREIGLVFEDLNGHLFFGRGFGASIVSMDRHFILLAPDHAYIYILWKMGIIGLIIWSMIQLLFIKRCLFILKKGTIAEEKIFALTALLNLFGLMVIGLSNCALTTYEYIFIWSAIIATIEIISRKYAS